MADDDTFINVTKRNIYDLIMEMKNDNTEQHAEIIKHQLKTNGKVKINTLISKAALAGALIALAIITGLNLYPLI